MLFYYAHRSKLYLAIIRVFLLQQVRENTETWSQMLERDRERVVWNTQLKIGCSHQFHLFRAHKEAEGMGKTGEGRS